MARWVSPPPPPPQAIDMRRNWQDAGGGGGGTLTFTYHSMYIVYMRCVYTRNHKTPQSSFTSPCPMSNRDCQPKKIYLKEYKPTVYTERKQSQMLLSKKIDLQRDFVAGVCLSEAPSPPMFLIGVV
jgi:hypothetical protein